jgi:hypothetical protein
MDVRILDLVSTKLLAKKLNEEVDLERLVNNPPNTLSAEELSNKIIEKVSMIRNTASDFQTWENLVNQMANSQKGENNKQ